MAAEDLTVTLRFDRNGELFTGWIGKKFAFTIDLRELGFSEDQVKQLIQQLNERDKQKAQED